MIIEQTTVTPIKLMYVQEINVCIHIIKMTATHRWQNSHFVTILESISNHSSLKLNKLKLLWNSINAIQQIILQLL